jgi:transposase-like protein
MERRTYTEEERAQVIARTRVQSPTRVAREMGIPRTTIRQWLGQVSVVPAQTSGEMVNARALAIADVLEDVAAIIGDKVRAALPGVPVEKAGDVRDLLVAHGIADEKVSFLRGGPTARNANVTVVLVAPDALRSGSLAVIEARKPNA